MAGPIIPAPDGWIRGSPAGQVFADRFAHRHAPGGGDAAHRGQRLADPTTDADLHGPVGDPLTITSPACGAVMTVVPTATQVPMAVQDTPVREAEVAVTVDGTRWHHRCRWSA